MTPDVWLEQYYSGEFFTGRFDHLKLLVQDLDLNSFSAKVITIAGTNGKGETSRCITKLLSDQSVTFGLWTSPHLVRVNERFHFDGVDIGDAELLSTFESLQVISKERKVKLSYFEFLFISFLILVKNKNIDFLILEVGLGGRLDAVNVLNADVSVVTSISRDHQDILGQRFEQILGEKLGILRDNTHLFTSLELDYLNAKVKKEINNRSIVWTELFSLGLMSKNDNFSVRNQKLAYKIVSFLLNKDLVYTKDCLDFAKRYQFEKCGALFELFPSHNTDGLRKLVQFLKDATYTNYDYVLISYSDRSIDDLRVMTAIVKKFFVQSKLLLYRYNHYKAVHDDHLYKISEEFGLEVTDDKKLFNKINSTTQNKVLVTGSNYFLGNFIHKHSRPSS